jgi:hypothetical protein
MIRPITPELETLGRRVMTWKHFEWRLGMFVVHPEGNRGHGWIYRLKSKAPRGPNDYPYLEAVDTQTKLWSLSFLARRKQLGLDGPFEIELVARKGRARTSREFVEYLEEAR